MAKFYGAIGYALPKEIRPGYWADEIVEKNYRGDIVMDQRRWQPDDKVNDDLNLDNSVSIVADGYAYENIGNMKYIVWNNAPWKIQSLSINRPRVVIQIGGIYNGARPTKSP
jgi:hypothetical protein